MKSNRPRAVTSSTSENISNCIFIYLFELDKNMEEESIVISDFIHGPDSSSDSYTRKLNVGASLPCKICKSVLIGNDINP